MYKGKVETKTSNRMQRNPETGKWFVIGQEVRSDHNHGALFFDTTNSAYTVQIELVCKDGKTRTHFGSGCTAKEAVYQAYLANRTGVTCLV